jgi:hypothetical protein
MLQVVTELGDRLITRVPREADLESLTSQKPRMIPIPGLGISKQWGKMDVKRVWTKITVGYGVDGILFAVNKNLPELVESEVALEARKKKEAPPETEEEKQAKAAGTMGRLWEMGQKASNLAEMAGVGTGDE